MNGAAATQAHALELRHLRKRFGNTEIIRDLSMTIRHGERVAIIGPNGAGKSTLFNLISGGTRATSGEVLLDGVQITSKRSFEINRLGLARSFQISNLFFNLSVFDNLRCSVLWSMGYRYAFWRRLRHARDANQRTEEMLESLGLAHRRAELASRLSYAEQRALEIGMTVAGGARVILLDEPTAGMSRGETAHFTGLLRKLTHGRTLLTVEHDMSVVFNLADRVAVLAQGELIAFDTPESIRANALVQQAYLGTADAELL
ncbi:ABC transporter ATP-binding protein [Diaphorobacter aerolatus]|uniref:ABC transporter ATP-binding protein n=1 Tax=Diaphorobacter aerolatus TaxID=1288495 RepID=A0A7H0GK66_9BURK|nr:ABC transporter ATP-binding protein [Diaphorobacter aerolatus]QNP48682.1 ABC transporter ATP-binding protein [Diaphorobacter aerolatus]